MSNKYHPVAIIMSFKQLFLIAICSLLLLYTSCRKTDEQVQETNEPKKIFVIEERFFNTNRSNNPGEKLLVDFIKRKNEKDRFVVQTVKQIGYPRWDRYFKSTRKN